jgi:hypothetical protein
MHPFPVTNLPKYTKDSQAANEYKIHLGKKTSIAEHISNLTKNTLHMEVENKT